MQEVLQYYIQSFFEIIYEDRIFDKTELVIILNSISFSCQYLVDMFGSLNSFLGVENREGEEEEDEEIAARAREFSSICSRTTALADSYSSEFVTVFCQGEGRIMDKYVIQAMLMLNLMPHTYIQYMRDDFDFRYIDEDNVFNVEDDENCLLGHLNRLLRFLHTTLKLSSEEETERYNRLIQERLFRTLDDKMVERHDQMLEIVRARLDGDRATRAAAAIAEIVGFRRSLSLEESPKLTELGESLRVQGSTTLALIAEHQDEIWKMIQEEEEEGKEEDSHEMAELVRHGFNVGYYIQYTYAAHKNCSGRPSTLASWRKAARWRGSVNWWCACAA